MVSRRVKAIFELVMGVFVLRFVFRTRKFVSEHAEEMDEDEPKPFSPTAVAIGGMMSILNAWLSDRDAFDIRTNRRRRLLFSLIRSVQRRVISRFVSTPDSFEVSYGLGAMLGLIAYRVWYGVLHPLPGPEE